MALARKLSEADIYHVVARGTGRQLLFEDDDDYRTFLGLMKSNLNKHQVELYAWCLMSNHVHLLVHGSMPDISQCMQRLLGSYARYFNEKTGRVGHLFQERFTSQAVNDERYLLTVLAYIHHNPQKAKIAAYNEYKWSSYREYFGMARFCATSFVEALFDGPSDYGQFHANFRDDQTVADVDRPRSATRAMPDSMALSIARDVLGRVDVSELKRLEKPRRDSLLARLKEAGLSIKQIERLTGIGRGAIARA